MLEKLFFVSFGHVTKLQLSCMASRGQERSRKVVQRFGPWPHSKKVPGSVLGDFLGAFLRGVYTFSSCLHGFCQGTLSHSKDMHVGRRV